MEKRCNGTSFDTFSRAEKPFLPRKFLCSAEKWGSHSSPVARALLSRDKSLGYQSANSDACVLCSKLALKRKLNHPARGEFSHVDVGWRGSHIAAIELARTDIIWLNDNIVLCCNIAYCLDRWSSIFVDSVSIGQHWRNQDGLRRDEVNQNSCLHLHAFDVCRWVYRFRTWDFTPDQYYIFRKWTYSPCNSLASPKNYATFCHFGEI